MKCIFLNWNTKTMDEWMIACSLLKRGARWGDLEVFTIEENIEILTQPSRKSPPDLVSIVTTVRTPHKKRHKFIEKLAKQSLKKKTVQCTTCSFARNTHPPEHFSEAQKLHCCVYCSITGGRKHGGRCQRISI